MRKLATGAYAALLVLLAAAPAVAQAAPPQYQSSEPSEGATVHEAPDRIEVTFDQPLDEDSVLTVFDECDRRIDDGNTDVSGSSMSVALDEKPAGHYHVEYVAVGIGGITGENEDHFTFTAHGGPSCDGTGNGHKNGHGNGNGNGHKNGHGNGTGNGHGSGHGNGAGHDDTGHSTGTDHTTDHGSGAGPAHGGHDDSTAKSAASGHSGGHAGNGSRASAAGDFDGITSSDTARRLLTRANSTTLLISLALCVGLGILGGTVLRATGSR